MATIELPQELAQKYMQSVKAYDQIQSNYQKMLMENQARQAAGKPWANALATIAGSLAANDPNPITRGLGQAAQQLNPTRAQLQAQQMQLLQGQAQAAGQGLQAAEGMYKMQGDMSRPKFELEKQKADDARAYKLLENARRAAAGGQPVSSESFMAGASQMGFGPEAAAKLYQLHVGEAAAYKSGREDMQAKKESLIQKASDLARDRATDRDNRRFGQRLATMREGFQNSISANKFEFEKNLATHKAQIGLEYKKLAETNLIPVMEMRKLEDANVTDSYLTKVRSALSRPEIKEITGALFTYDPKTGEVKTNMQVLTPRLAQSTDRVEFEALMSHEIPRLLSVALRGGMGGASLMRTDKGIELIKKLGSSINDRPDQILAIMDQVSDTNNDIKAGIMRARRNVDWTGQYAPLVGLDNPENARYFEKNLDAMGMPMSSPSAAKSGKSQGATAAPGYTIGQKDGGYTYVGGDPKQASSWQKN